MDLRMVRQKVGCTEGQTESWTDGWPGEKWDVWKFRRKLDGYMDGHTTSWK